MPKHVIRYTWEVITDVLRLGSKSRMTRRKANLERPRRHRMSRIAKNATTRNNRNILDLEQKVKAVDSRQITKESTDEAKDVNAAAATQESKADETEGSRAADASEASAAGDKIFEKRQAAAPEGTTASKEQKKKRRKEQSESKRRDNAPRKERGGKGREEYGRCVSSTGSSSC